MSRLTLNAMYLIMTLGLILPVVVPAKQQALTKRIAVVIGANNGGKERVRLKYAESDARTFAHVLQSLGGIHHKDIHLITNPSKKTVVKTLARVSKILKKEKERPLTHLKF